MPFLDPKQPLPNVTNQAEDVKLSPGVFAGVLASIAHVKQHLTPVGGCPANTGIGIEARAELLCLLLADGTTHGIYRLDGDRLTWPGNNLGCDVSGPLAKAILQEMAQASARPLDEVRKAAAFALVDDNAFYAAQRRLNLKLLDHAAPFHFEVGKGILEVVRAPYTPRPVSPKDGRRKAPRKPPRRQ